MDWSSENTDSVTSFPFLFTSKDSHCLLDKAHVSQPGLRVLTRMGPAYSSRLVSYHPPPATRGPQKTTHRSHSQCTFMLSDLGSCCSLFLEHFLFLLAWEFLLSFRPNLNVTSYVMPVPSPLAEFNLSPLDPLHSASTQLCHLSYCNIIMFLSPV